MIELPKIFDQVSRVQVKSITDPLFRFSGIFFSLGTISAIFKTASWITITLFSVGGLILLVGLFVFIFFCLKNPDYLRSEGFQLKNKTINLLGDKDNSANPHVKELKYITSPYSKEINGHAKKNLGESNE